MNMEEHVKRARILVKRYIANPSEKNRRMQANHNRRVRMDIQSLVLPKINKEGKQ